VILAQTLPRTWQAHVRRWPTLPLLYSTVFPVAAALITVAFWPMWQQDPFLALGNEFLSLALVAAGLLLFEEPVQQSATIMLIAAAALLAIGWVNRWNAGPLPLISVPASPLGIVLAGWAMFRYPYLPSEMRRDRRFFIIIFVWFVIGELAVIVVSRPAWNDFPATAWWPALHPDHPLFEVISRIVPIGGIAFAVIYMGLWLRRWRNSHGIARRLVTPIAIASAVVCAATIAELVIAVTSASGRDLDQVYEIEAYLQIGVPLAFAVSVMRRRFARTRIVGLLLSLQGPARLPSITHALRSVFEDPRLEIVDWPSVPPVLQSPATRQACRVPEPPGSVNGRLCLPIKSSSGEHLAAVLADPSLSPNDDLVQAALTASSFALENAWLDEALRAQLQEVRDSRRRIIEAGTAERRRLERDLHDGTQQRLLGLKIMLATAEADIGDGAARAVVSRIRTELGDVLDELRDLAHGIHPAVLSQVGLAQAVQSLADRYTTPVQVDLPAGRLAESAELTAYFVIAESITNAIKHADAGEVTVTGLLADGLLRIEIADDGRGGASMSAGTGIRGLADRVRGVGGDLVVESPAGRGTRIEARIPCA
jgi:signal transduction histidine kinase